MSFDSHTEPTSTTTDASHDSHHETTADAGDADDSPPLTICFVCQRPIAADVDPARIRDEPAHPKCAVHGPQHWRSTTRTAQGDR